MYKTFPWQRTAVAHTPAFPGVDLGGQTAGHEVKLQVMSNMSIHSRHCPDHGQTKQKATSNHIFSPQHGVQESVQIHMYCHRLHIHIMFIHPCPCFSQKQTISTYHCARQKKNQFCSLFFRSLLYSTKLI